MKSTHAWFALVGAAVVCACSGAGSSHPASREESAERAAASIKASDLLRHIAELSSDRYEGRGPGTPGEELSVAYITEQFKSLGLAPGNPDGTYVQNVPLVGFRAKPTASFTTAKGVTELAFPADYVAITRRNVEHVAVDAPLVFVGYGVVAPEFKWDDFKGVDVKGKAIVMLVNDPPVASMDDPSKLDDHVFGGRAMTYYGRWTYKYEIAAQKGAAAAILIHETGPAGYPYEVVSGSWSRENFDIVTPDGNAGRAAVESWINEKVARDLFAASGADFDTLKKAANSRSFEPVELAGSQVHFALDNTLRTIQSRNVVARLVGGDERVNAEHIVYSAHWDHLGRDESLPGDQIYNGAEDNASGIAGLLELAQAFKTLEPKPARSILFLAVTAEEKGLLGSKYYAANPLYPLNKTLADINIDGLNLWGKARDIASIGLGNSTLHDVLAKEAAVQGRVVVGDSEPEKGAFYRSDHFEFAKRGVPALHFAGSTDYIDRPAGWGKLKSDEYTAHRYHKPADEIQPDWNLAGAVDDLRLFFKLGLDLSAATEWPRWADGAEFKAVRDASLAKP
jgi:Zn-dependent M28 family amino/carboxypeptidase